MSHFKNGNSSSSTNRSNKSAYTTQSNQYPHQLADLEFSEKLEDIYNTELSTEQRGAILIKHFKNYKISQDIDIERLYSEGINMNQADSDGKTLLMYAAEKGAIDIVQALIESNADVYLRDKHNKSALFHAIETNTENLDVVSLLLERADIVDNTSSDGMTPLLKAVERGQYEIVKLLLEKGALINHAHETTGDTALHFAVRKDDRKMIELLFEKHCDASKKNKKKQTIFDLIEPGTELHDFLSSLATKSKEIVATHVQNSINIPTSTANKTNQSTEDKISAEFTDIVNQIDHSQKFQNQEKGEKAETKKSKSKPELLQPSNTNLENISEKKENEDYTYLNNHFLVEDSSDEHSSNNQNKDLQRKRNISGASGASYSSVASGNSEKQRENIGPLETGSSDTISNSITSPNLKSNQSFSKTNNQNQNLNPQGFNAQNPNQKGKNKKVQQNNGQLGNNIPQNYQYANQVKQQQQGQQQQQQQTIQSQQQFQNFQPQQQFQQQQHLMNVNMNFNGKGQNQLQFDQSGNQKYPKNQNRMNDQQRNQMNQSGIKGNDIKQNFNEQAISPSKEKPQQNFQQHPQNGISFQNQQYYMQNPMGPQFSNTNINQSQMGKNGNPAKVVLNLGSPSQIKSLEETANYQTLKEKCQELQNKNNQLLRDKNDLKHKNDELVGREKNLQEVINERETQIKTLSMKNENLEKAIKNRESDGGVIYKAEKSIMTEFSPEEYSSIEKLLEEPRPNNDPQMIEDMYIQLHEEILQFENSVNKYNQENKEHYDSLIKKITEAMTEISPDLTCEIYGSFATGLSLPWSDIDIVIKVNNSNYNMNLLDQLESNLKKKSWVNETKNIRNTSVPVLKITCALKKNSTATKKIDISIQDPRHNGLSCVELVKEYLQAYPSLRPLVLVLKHLLFTLNLNDTYSGGLSSYGLILMIVWYFQSRESVNSLNPIESYNLARFLLGFLYVYGTEYDYVNFFWVIPKKYTGKGKLDPMDMSSSWLMYQNPPTYTDPKIYIQDPLSVNNNVGRSTFHIKEIKLSFMAAYFEAHKPCNCEVHNYVAENLGDKKRKCSSIFKRMLNAYQPNR